jgi:hypothetical protein
MSMSIAVTPTSNATYSAISGQSPSCCKFKKISCSQFEHFWSYGGKVLLITRNVLNAIARSSSAIYLAGVDLPRRIKSIVTPLKLFAIVSVPFTLMDLKSVAQKIFNGFRLKDAEGVALATLSISIILADAFDSVTTFANAAFALILSHPFEIFATAGMPIAAMLNGAGTLSRTIQIAKGCNLYRKLNPEFLEKHKSKAAFKKYLEKSFGVDKEEIELVKLLSEGHKDKALLDKIEKLREKKKTIILRSIPKDAIEDFQKLFELLDSKSNAAITEQEIANITSNLKNIRQHLQKKVNVDLLGIMANLISISALVLFFLGIMNPLPFLLLAIAFTVRLMALNYQESKSLTNK